MSQFRALVFLGRGGPTSVGDVATALGVSQPTATETLDRLVRAGLAQRWTDAEDRRVTRHALTEAGREIIDRPWEARRAVLTGALRRASPADREAIARGLELLCQALEGPEAASQSWGADAAPTVREGRPATGPKRKREGGTA
jgi:DNA-binding MarR family transcriptional regulator